MFTFNRLVICALALAVILGCALPAPAASERTGEQIYKELCVKCHGPQGQGVAGKADEVLRGSRSLASLTRVIDKTMPEDDPEKCVGEDAAKVAAYIYHEFYAPTARLRIQPARIEFSRLTVRQYHNSIADLIATFRQTPPPEIKPGGLRAQYYASRNFGGRNSGRLGVINRIEPKIDYVFEDANPDPVLLPGDEFSIRWTGSVIAEDTGEYEFILKTENGSRLWVNGETRTLIDAWVSSGSEPREHRQKIFLLGGRVYPIKLDLFRFKDKTASVSLQWKPPHGPQQVIPVRNLSPTGSPETLVVSTPFPADDSSIGYERGTSISKAWDSSTTSAAIEVANKIVEQLDDLTRTRQGSSDRTDRVREFIATLAERAFRRPLTASEKALFVEAPFRDAKDEETGIKRAVLLVFKSPRFLYPELATGTDAHAVASRLSLALWDSVPDQPLLEAAAGGKLSTPQEVEKQARRMLADPRAQSKVRDFLHHWLEMDDASDLSKDRETYPDFNELLLADLRTSLDLFLDEVVWSEKSDYRDLLLADYLFMNERLAAFYGVKASEQGEFEKVPFEPNLRSGVLTHPFLLSALAYHKNSSPIHRGVFLTRNIVGRALQPPPMAIEFNDDRFDPTLTMREKVTELTRPAACQGCHVVINPLGFSLEHYDAVGRFRTLDNNKPIDPISDFNTNDGKTIRLTGPRDVANYAVNSPEAHRAFINQLFNHTAKQPAEAYGPETLEKLRREFVDSGFNIRELLIDIATVSSMYTAPANEGKTP